MKKNSWDSYFKEHLKPLETEWGKKDLQLYRKWYDSWIQHINKKIKLLGYRGKQPECFEIGSSIGAVTSLLHEKGLSIVGSDISEEIVLAAKKTNPQVEFIYCDIQKGIKTNKKYDIIFAFEVLEHLPKLKNGIRNIYSSLKKGGYFIGSSPYPFKKNFSDPTHCNVKYPYEWKELFYELGFSSIHMYAMSFMPFIWKIHKKLNIIFPFYVPFPYVVSTTLIIAKK